MTDACFQLKGSVFTTIILELYQYSRENFTQQLKDKISQAPGFFHQSPVVISLEKISDDATEIDFAELLDICRQFGLQPMAFKCTKSHFKSAINATGLTLLSDTAARTSDQKPLPEASTRQASTPVDEKKLAPRKSKIVTRPVRSGQQVYSEGADLIILSQVSEGAEVLADGNIHIYGTLRGRALAGINGDTSARVFCQKLEAELISIAGNFILSDFMRKQAWQQAVQVYLDEQTLHIAAV
jgi:septum site-determining protein MinC